MKPEDLTPFVRRLLEEAARNTVETYKRLSFTDRTFNDVLALPAQRHVPVVIYWVLIEEIDRLRNIVSVIENAPTEPMVPTIGGPCEPHYHKGRHDLARLLLVEIASAFVRTRLDGDDTYATERIILDAIRKHGRPA